MVAPPISAALGLHASPGRALLAVPVAMAIAVAIAIAVAVAVAAGQLG